MYIDVALHYHVVFLRRKCRRSVEWQPSSSCFNKEQDANYNLKLYVDAYH